LRAKERGKRGEERGERDTWKLHVGGVLSSVAWTRVIKAHAYTPASKISPS